jgi:HlyD family secretion protein
MNPKRIAIPLLIVLAISALGIFFWSRRSSEESHEIRASGTVEATEARLGFQTGGRITSIDVREGERVRQGQLLARLETAELDARLAQARARADSARAQLAELETGSRPEEIAQAEAAVSASRERLQDARRDLARTEILLRGGAVPPEAEQKAATAAQVAESQLRQANEQLRFVRRGPRSERIDAARAQVAEADAAARAVEAQLANSVVISPHDGIATVRHREPNEVIAPGQPLVTVMNPGDRWVRIYVPETRIGAVQVGQNAEITADTFPGRKYAGRVTFISPEAEFTPKSVQTAEERVRLVYAVKVRITGDDRLELKPGMPADVVLRPDSAQP